ncbi:MAG: hypothetical protein ING08_16525 [Roseomonas sp.]|nr:hypothetical protein [Roseomonas sp.]MCA3381840.1 hypothetical protein [Roseomonas sp.]
MPAPLLTNWAEKANASPGMADADNISPVRERQRKFQMMIHNDHPDFMPQQTKAFE